MAALGNATEEKVDIVTAQVSQSQTSFGFGGTESTKTESGKATLPVKLVIYDFDQTITKEHLYNALKHEQEEELKKMSDERLQEIFGGSERIQRLKEHFKRVASKCELAIISFGWVNVIINSMKRMDLFQHFAESIIIGRDSEELKTASAEKKECICRMKKDRKLKSDQIIFVDDSNHNITKSQSYCIAMLVQPAEGMSEDQMKEIEEKCDVYPAIEVTTPRTVAEQTSKEYPRNSAEQKENDNPLAKYRVDAPQWFDQLTNPEAETPVIQVGGDKTPSLSDSDLQYELNVPMLNSELEIAKQTPKNGLALLSSDDEDNEQKQSENTKSEAPTLSLNTDQIANED